MKKFILHGDMASHFCESITLNVSTMREAISALCSNFPDFRKYYIDKSLSGISYVFVDSNKNEHEQYCLDLPLLDSEYHILPSINGSSGAGDLASSFGQNMVLGYLMSVFTDMLGDGLSDDGTPEYEIITTNSFIYSQNENTVEQGSPVPVVYGQLRVGSKVVQSSIQNYDYDYDAASIYTVKPRGNNFTRILHLTSSDYSHSDPKKISDLRNGTTENFATLNYGDSTKRVGSAGLAFVGNKQKAPTQNQENEPLSQFYGGQGTSNEQYDIGPSTSSKKVKAKPNSSWWDHGSPITHRPFLFPPAGQKDYEMRPQGSRDLCVERPTVNGSPMSSEQDRCDAWRSASQPLRVGNRGSYHKLESISINKSLEVLSEGPIIGLANPINGFDRDNGKANFPYGAESISYAGGNISVETLKYNADSDTLTSQNNTSSIPIINPGDRYANFSNQVIQANTDGVNSLKIYIDGPSNVSNLNIGTIRFIDPQSPEGITNGSNNSNDSSDIHFVSENGLFLLSQDDGELQPNTNSLTEINRSLNSIYLVNENTEEDGEKPVFQFNLLERDKESLGTNFSMGNGLGFEGFEFEVNANSKDFSYTAQLSESSSFDRTSESKCLDLTRYQDVFDSNFNALIDNEFANNTSSTVPLTSLGWDKMARIYYEGGSELNNNLNESVTITLATASWTVRTSYSYNTGETFTSHSGTAQVTISLRDYVSLNNVTITSSITGIPSTCKYSSSTNCRRSFNWNSGGYTAFKNGTYTYNVPSKTVNITQLIRADSSFANNLFNALNAKTGNALKYVDFNSRRYLKFGVGSGSSTAPGGRTGGLPAYMIDSNNKQNFDSVEILSDGALLDDDSDHPKGFYCPFIFPRVTVFVIRKAVFVNGSTSMTRTYICPTYIDAVASVTSRGTIEKLHLLKTPDTPVWDTELKRWTPIMPHVGKNTPHATITSNGNSMSQCQDYGIICEIDKSNNPASFKYDVDKGKLKNRLDSTNIHASWAGHIRYNELAPGSPESVHGMFSEQVDVSKFGDGTSLSKSFSLEDTGNEWSIPDRYSSLSLGLEKLNLSSGYKKSSILNSISNLNFSSIFTGRISSVNLSDPGVGYSLKNGNGNGQVLSFTVYNKTYSIESINIDDNGLGYKPNSDFFVYGFSNSKVDSSNNGYSYISFKGKCKTDSFGSVELVKILDKGFGFSSLALPEDFIFCTTDETNETEVSAITRGVIPNLNPTNNIKNIINFPKRSFILKADDSHLSVPGAEGSMGKFFVKQTGLGFNFNQIITNVFGGANTFIPPSFRVTISNNSLSSITVEDPGSGYSSSDNSIKLSFSSPTIDPVNEDDIDDDPQAWARSIFLNDVPIRDKNDRFNFSKFHFDMRIGHYKNGNLDRSIPDNVLAQESRSALMNNEFRLPSHTKMVEYPLYGPRNHGEKDYYYTHTIKNPEVTSVTVSLKINQLHYVYEGDESAMYINLIPLIAAGLGIMAGKALAEGIVAALAPKDPTMGKLTSTQVLAQSFTVTPCTGIGTSFQGRVVNPMTTGTVTVPTAEMAKQAKMASFYGALFGAVGGLAATFVLKYLIKCSQVPFLCFKVGELIKNSGEIWPAKVTLAIEHGVEGNDLKSDTVIIRGCATNPYVKDIVIDIDPPEGDSNNFKNRILKIYRLTREMDPVTGGLVESRYSIDANVHSITEHIEGFFSYPNTSLIGTRVNSKDFPSIPKKEYLIKGRIINVPSNYNEVDGTYSDPWDGTFIQQWTSNPAWVIYDLLINERYGCGKYGIKESDIDKWSFYTFAKFCDERIETTIDGVLNNGSPYMERRHMCNLYIDSEKEAYEYIKDLLKIYNSTINFSGGQIYITKDSSISDSGATMIFNHTNVTEEGFSYSTTPSTKRITAASVDYLDERDNYMLKTEYVEDQHGISEHGYSHAKMAGTGITRRGEAHRLCWSKILTRQLEKEVIHFKSGLQSAYLKIGDVINVLDNNKISRHSGGRIKKILGRKVRNTLTIYDVEIDIPIEALNGVTSILVEVQDNISPESTRASNFLEFTISISSGFQLELFTNDTNAGSIFSGSTWMIESNYSANISPKPFRVKQIKEVKNMEFEITAVEYIEEKYSQVDSSTSNLNGSYDQSREYSGHEIIV